MSFMDEELLQAFFAESRSILETFEEDLILLDDEGPSPELTNSMFRSIHTIKGNSSFMDLKSITELTHLAESILDRIRKSEIEINDTIKEALYEFLEALRALIGEQGQDFDIGPCMDTLNLACDEEYAAKASAGTAEKEQISLEKKQDLAPVDPSVAVVAGEAKIEGAQADSQTAPATPDKLYKKKSSTIRIEDEKLDKVVNLLNELEIIKYSLEGMPLEMEKYGEELSALRFDLETMVSKMARITNSMNSIILGVRLVPVQNVFKRFPRIVKDLAKKLGKSVELEIKNGSSELDKSIVEAITDPMTHLIRNSCDHGIESSSEREQAGKNPVGKIILDSYVEGNSVVIDIIDNGRGINSDDVLRKAIKAGIVPEERQDSMQENEKLGLIFAPGFSTASEVTDISGRGVGMDVVKSSINKLKGTVLIDSKRGKGTKISLKFPLSVTVMRCLYTFCNETCLAFPLEKITESRTILRSELMRDFAKEDLSGDKFLEVYFLSELLELPNKYLENRSDEFFAIQLQDSDGDREVCLIVDQFSIMEEAIVQSVDSYISAIPGIQGGIIRKDGSVTLAVNPDGLLEFIDDKQPFAFVRKLEKSYEFAALAEFLEMAGDESTNPFIKINHSKIGDEGSD